MRLLIVGDVYPDSFADNLTTSLRDLGHDVETAAAFPEQLSRLGRPARRLAHELQAFPELARRLQRQVVERADRHRPELVVNVDYRLAAAVVDELRAATRAPVVFWFPDAPGNLGREVHAVAGYDALFFTDTGIVERYRQTLGLNAFFLPEACNPRWHRPVGDVGGPQAPSVLVAGNVYATRFVLLRELLRRGIGVTVHGGPWARWLPDDPELRRCYTGSYLTREEKARAFRRACVVLNSLSPQESDGLNCRLFEAAGCGAVVLTEWRDRLPDFFEVPTEVRSYRDLDELAAAVRELAAMPVEDRSAMAAAASARAHREHTYAQRFEQILAVMGTG